MQRKSASALAVLLMFGQSACGDAATESKATSVTDVVVTDESNGRQVDIAVGRRFVVKLIAQLGTGYSWSLQSQSEPELVLLKSGEGGREQPAPGGTDIQMFVFEARKVGLRELHFAYRRPWEAGTEPQRTFLVMANVTR